MDKNIKRIIIGLIFISFNFNIGFIDILNNSIGYFLIVYNIQGLAEKSLYMKRTITSGRILAFLSLPFSIYRGSQGGIDIGPLEKYFPYDGTYYIVLAMIEVYFIYNLVMIFYRLAIKKQQEDLGRSFLNYSSIYAILITANLITRSFAINFNNRAITLISIGIGIALAISSIYFMRLLRNYDKVTK